MALLACGTFPSHFTAYVDAFFKALRTAPLILCTFALRYLLHMERSLRIQLILLLEPCKSLLLEVYWSVLKYQFAKYF